MPSNPKLYSQWAATFKRQLPRRVTLQNIATAELGVAALNIDRPEDKIAVEMYPGVGVWSTALANAGFKRVLTLEPMPTYMKHIKKTAEASNGIIDVIPADGYNWETYNNLKDPKWLGNLPPSPWENVHPNLLYTGTIPQTSKGELFLAQLYSCIFNRSAMFQFGRVPMALWCPISVIKKTQILAGEQGRNKLSIVAESCATTEIVMEADKSHFWPNADYQLLKVTPLPTRLVTSSWDVFEYVVRHLLVAQKQKLSKIIKGLGPGAEILLQRIDFDPDTEIGKMTLAQLDAVAIRFDEWPLKPLDLYEDSEIIDKASRRRDL